MHDLKPRETKVIEGDMHRARQSRRRRSLELEADSLATAATLVMGEGSESQPLAVIEEAPVEWTDAVDRNELKISREQDMFKSLFEE